MSEQLSPLTEAELFILGWQYPSLHLIGDFKMALAHAMRLADGSNLSRLEIAFPDLVWAFQSYRSDLGWWSDLQQRAKRLGVLPLHAD